MSINAPSESALVAATNWIAGLLTGSLATSFAVLAIAGVGFGLLAGRVAVRRAVQVVLGMFILFGAPTLVRELTGAARGGAVAAAQPGEVSPPPAPTAPPSPNPYAGASVPM